MKKAIGMKCNKEQFNAVKSKLKGVRVESVFPEEKTYLVNNWCGFDNSLATMYNAEFTGREIYKTWNEKVFLEACGIETKTNYRITKETILKYEMKEEFPEIFELQKDFTGWCKTSYGGNEKYLTYFENGILQYGFDGNGKWFNKGVYESFVENHHFKATNQEVFEALKNEAVKRGYVESAYIKSFVSGYSYLKGNEYDIIDGIFKLNGNWLMKNGKWAEIITREELEERLGVQIE